jgi:ADP-ribose pyrophosphatase
MSASLQETCIKSETVYKGELLEVRRDLVRLPNGGTTGREYIAHPGAVMVLPLLDNGRLVMERQFRYPVGQVMIEFPAGKIDAGEPVWECAMRELFEETGYRAREWARAGLLNNAIGYSNEGIEIWFARGLVKGNASLDEGEFVETFEATQDELLEWVHDGSLTDAKTITGLLWLEKWRAGRWDLAWRPTPSGPLRP